MKYTMDAYIDWFLRTNMGGQRHRQVDQTKQMNTEEDLNKSHGWLVIKEKCRLCGYTCIGVVPEERTEDLECAQCGNMSCDCIQIYSGNPKQEEI